MSISRLALLIGLTAAVPPIVRHMQVLPEPLPALPPAPAPRANPQLASDVLASLDRIGELGPSLLVWHECERLRAAVRPLAAAA